ncbi:hypothetical protein BDP27DRAFT_1434246 [Rhodocollybia butyracea]|uniref:Uncharacterized protein n=1 Tax=Rhodocollybia butyracea TaxID=206335 RepID=A0A9P5P7G7_9AGAR|nr:hypothetical protein BDP27DRAFT_1434246 [Rhodocollybia butyracea]
MSATRTITGENTTHEDTQTSYLFNTPGYNRQMANTSELAMDTDNNPSFQSEGHRLGAAPNRSPPRNIQSQSSHRSQSRTSTPMVRLMVPANPFPTPQETPFDMTPIRPRPTLAHEAWSYAAAYGPSLPLTPGPTQIDNLQAEVQEGHEGSVRDPIDNYGDRSPTQVVSPSPHHEFYQTPRNLVQAPATPVRALITGERHPTLGSIVGPTNTVQQRSQSPETPSMHFASYRQGFREIVGESPLRTPIQNPPNISRVAELQTRRSGEHILDQPTTGNNFRIVTREQLVSLGEGCRRFIGQIGLTTRNGTDSVESWIRRFMRIANANPDDLDDSVAIALERREVQEEMTRLINDARRPEIETII